MNKYASVLASCLIALLLMCSPGFAQSPPCPATEAAVEPQCLPAPPWVHHRNIVVMPNGCRVLVDWCDQWVCRGFAGISRSRLSVSQILYLDLNCDRAYGPVSLDALVGNLLQAMVEQGIIPNDGPPHECDTPEDIDHFYEVMTTRCYKTYSWEGIIYEGGREGGTPVDVPMDNLRTGIQFCTSDQICLRQWKFCRKPDGTIIRTLSGVFAARSDGSITTGPAVCDGEWAENPISISGDYLDVRGTLRVGLRIMGTRFARYGCISACE
jgi:hypothetical protein